MNRPSLSSIFMEVARAYAKRSTCLRRQVGAVIVKDGHQLASGYNGPPKGLKHCEELGGCLREKMKVPSGERHELCRAVHAEENAVLMSAKFGVKIEGSTMYSTIYPCSMCAKRIINVGIKKVVVCSDYTDDMAKEMFKEAGIEVYTL